MDKYIVHVLMPSIFAADGPISAAPKLQHYPWTKWYAQEGPMNPRPIALIVVLISSVVAVWPAHAEVPTAADFAACNAKAAEEAKADGVSASPRTDLPTDATKLPPDVRPKPDSSGRTLSSDKDPQIEGLAADRANDKIYVAAYRACMRRRGF